MKSLCLTVLALAALSTSQLSLRADALDLAWTRRSPLTGSVVKVIYAGDQFVAVGANGTILTSPDGEEWKEQRSGTTVFLISVAHGRGQFVALDGDTDVVLTSADAIGWTLHHAGLSRFTDVAFGQEMFVAVGLSGLIATSSNGTQWEQVPRSTGCTLEAIAFGQGSFVVSAASTSRLLMSEDGRTWRAGLNPFATVQHAICFGATNFVSVGYLSSLAGTSSEATWQIGSLGEEYFGVTFGQDVFVAVGRQGRVSTSQDGRAWQHASVGPGWVLKSVAYSGSRFVTVGPSLLFSDDAKTWSRPQRGIFDPLRSIAVNGDLLVAVGGTPGNHAQIMRSTDGVHWTRLSLESDGALYGIVAGPPWVAVGEHGLVASSVDGRVWQTQTVGEMLLHSVHEQDGLVVAVGEQGTIFSSKALSSWTRHPSDVSTALHGVAYGAGKWVVVGDAGVLLSGDSLDALSLRPMTNKAVLTGVHYEQSLFVVVGEGGTILTSMDGNNWVPRSSGITNDLRKASFGDDHHVAVGDSGVMLTSRDGIAWRRHQPDSEATLSDAAYAFGSFFAVGDEGRIIQSKPTSLTIAINVRGMPVSPRNAPFLTVQGGIGHLYQLQVSTNLVGWNTLREFDSLGSDGTYQTVDGWGTNGWRFYRVELSD